MSAPISYRRSTSTTSVFNGDEDASTLKKNKKYILAEMNAIDCKLPTGKRAEKQGQLVAIKILIRDSKSMDDVVRYYNEWRTIVIEAGHEYEDEKLQLGRRKAEIIKECTEFYKEYSNISWSHKVKLLQLKQHIEQSTDETEQEHYYNEWISYSRIILAEETKLLQAKLKEITEEKEAKDGQLLQEEPKIHYDDHDEDLIKF